MCQTKPVWSHAGKYNQRFEIILLKLTSPTHGTSDILDMAFISPGLSSQDFSFSVSDDHMGSDHPPIQISVDKPPKHNIPLTEPRYKTDNQRTIAQDNTGQFKHH